ncbi:hypothetical protein IAT40_005435 [Kwoniella sp. CBS 6097]
MSWFATFLATGPPESDRGVPPQVDSDRPGSEGWTTEDMKERHGEWSDDDDAIGRWKWRSRVWRGRWDSAPIPEQYQVPRPDSKVEENPQPRSGVLMGSVSGTTDGNEDHDDGCRSRRWPAGTKFFSRRLGSGGSGTESADQDEEHDHVIPVGDASKNDEGSETSVGGGHRASNRSRNLAVLETMLRSSYRTGFNDALKLSPFMPVLPPSATTDQHQQPSISIATDDINAIRNDNDKSFILPVPGTRGADEHLSTAPAQKPLDYDAIGRLLLEIGTVLGVSAVVFHQITLSRQKMREVERGLKEVLALVQLKERSEAGSLGKIGNELRAVRGLIEGLEGKLTQQTGGGGAGGGPGPTKAIKRDNDESGAGGDAGAGSGFSTPGPGGMIRLLSPTEAKSFNEGLNKPVAPHKEPVTTENLIPHMASTLKIPSPSSSKSSNSVSASSIETNLVPKLNLINQQLATMVSQSVKQKQHTSDLTDSVSSIDRKIGGLLSDVGDVRERVKLLATATQAGRGIFQSHGFRSEGPNGPGALTPAHSDLWSKWYQAEQEVSSPSDDRSKGSRKTEDISRAKSAASTAASPHVQLAPSAVGLGLGMKSISPNLPSHEAHDHHDIMPLHDIRKAIEGVKKGYLADQADKTLKTNPSQAQVEPLGEQSSIKLPSPSPSSAGLSSHQSNKTVNVEEQSSSVPEPEVAQAPPTASPTPPIPPAPIECKHLVHSFPRDHLLIQPYPPYDRAEDIERATSHSTDIARVRYPARADFLEKNRAMMKLNQQDAEEQVVQKAQTSGRAMITDINGFNHAGESATEHPGNRKGVSDESSPVSPVTSILPDAGIGHPSKPNAPNPSIKRPVRASASATTEPAEKAQQDKPEARSTLASGSTADPSSTYTETPTGHWWTFHHTSPSNAWKIRGFGWYDSGSDSGTGSGPSLSEDTSPTGSRQDSKSELKPASGRASSGTAKSTFSDQSNNVHHDTLGVTGSRVKRQQKPKQAEEDRSVAGWAIERARKRWGDWPFY